MSQKNDLAPDWRNFYSCADWVRLNTKDGAIVMSRKPELVFLRSMRKGLIYPFSHDVDKIYDCIKDQGVTHIIVDDFSWTHTTRRYLYPVLLRYPNSFRAVYTLNDPRTTVYEVIR
jgi:hypothetical protein